MLDVVVDAVVEDAGVDVHCVDLIAEILSVALGDDAGGVEGCSGLADALVEVGELKRHAVDMGF